MMLKGLFLFVALTLATVAPAQQLLLNGGFEDENICTEYQVNCAPEAWISSSNGFSNYFKDPNRAYAGEHCMAIQAGRDSHPYDRSFICSQLLCGMKKGRSYRLKFFVKSAHAQLLDSMGVYFGPVEPLLERKPIHLLAPSTWLTPFNHFVEDSSWQAAAIDYLANGQEAFITIAYFGRHDIDMSTGIALESRFYVFVDNISLVPLDPDEKLCDDWQTVKQEIYDMDARHEAFDRALKIRRTMPHLPLRLTSTKTLRADTLVLPDLLFASGKKDLQPAALAMLDSFCRTLRGKTIDSLVIEGHTDDVGTDTMNDRLSDDRAHSVASYLQSCVNLFRVRVIARGYGSRAPVAANDTPANRQRNRRVELVAALRE